ncbi:TIGR03668 family PPOX class F420-dependent oxidoreductase [Actinomycetospora sp. NBRC 106378]|uniref:TIGR03668 family PPOX class F420-dependent oxidoreductase n=1 Tax=Actinomycetospora sp. NBRC 106378 TaxID=3032208 RepID=UPI0024A104F6|nr:TIGR03668 family PPOX class F420-dependent oxidoreductase [Actinomycetospora sp. NBRC 106378]GLZ53829.1 PPOX class F420-dependent oxidoreductase [Actinomycetospora sp. NBRC 106378]
MPTLGPDDARARFAAARVARLGTVTPSGAPHLVPVVFAVADDRVLIAVDQKPKRTRDLARLRHIEANPAVSLLVDEYSDDWSTLWWVRADGEASVRWDALDEARSLLADRYPQHAADPPEGPVIDVAVGRWSGWSAR